MSLSSEERDKIVAQFNNIKTIDDLHDDFHTFKELYDQRNILFCIILNNNSDYSWKSKNQYDNNPMGEWFVAGIDLPGIGTVTFHMENALWGILKIKELEIAPKWDNANSEIILKRLVSWALSNANL